MRKKKVVIIAPTGMLGSAVYNQLKGNYELILLYRKKDFLKLLPEYNNHIAIQCDLEVLYSEYKTGFTAGFVKSTFSNIVKKIGKIDGVINCAGLTKPHSLQKPELTFFINGAFPQILSEVYKEKLIQIATDCVFDGNKDAPYTEGASKFPMDLYGLSKSLGEPFQKSLVLRTSIIGEELHDHTLLISWLQKQTGEVFGFTNHFWNGITTKQFANICDEIISKREKYPQNGLFHIFSSDVTKYEMLEILKKKYDLPITIIPNETQKIDRRLRTIYDLSQLLRIPSFEKMIEEM